MFELTLDILLSQVVTNIEATLAGTCITFLADVLAGFLLLFILIQNLAGAASNKGSDVVTADDDGYAEGRIGDVMRTYFFDYTVNSAYTCKEFEGYTPAEGNKLLVAELTVKNTDRSTVTMYDTDFQIQWGDDDDDDAFDAPITYYSDAVSDDQLPEEYDLSVNEERTGLLVFEVPEDSKDYSISYLEQFSNDTKGDVFFVYFTAKDK